MSSDSPSKDSNSPENLPKSAKTPAKGTEVDLWDFDSEEEIDPESPKTEKKSGSISIPSRRINESPIQSKKPTERHIDPPAVAEDKPSEPAPEKKKTAPKKSATKEAAPAKAEPDPAATPEKEQQPSTKTDQKIKQTEEKRAEEAESSLPEESGSPPASFPINWKSIASTLSKSEKIGISALVAILAIGAILSVLHFSNRVPTRSILGEDLDLPVEGKLVKVTELDTYWREPITAGDDTDVVRRGTRLIPVVKITTESKNAAIRVLFRNEEGTVIGDPINRTIKDKAELRIPATAGFEDIGMHAAYRTGESPPWIVQILEAKESSLSIDKFELILETEISTDIR